jgi:hypothetical protein
MQVFFLKKRKLHCSIPRTSELSVKKYEDSNSFLNESFIFFTNLSADVEVFLVG